MPDGNGLRDRRVLMIEDEPLAALWLAAGLEDAGAKVCGPVAGRAEALAFLAAARVDLAVLDLGLLDGLAHDVARDLLARGVPFVILSGDPVAAEALGRELDGVPVLDKPATPESLVSALTQALDHRPPAAPRRGARDRPAT